MRGHVDGLFRAARFLRSFGSEGQGPGEFQQPLVMGLSGDELMVGDNINGRWSVWTLGGELVEERPADRAALGADEWVALADGSLLVHFDRGPMNDSWEVIGRLGAEAPACPPMPSMTGAPLSFRC